MPFGELTIPPHTAGVQPPDLFFTNDRPATLHYLRIYENDSEGRSIELLDIIRDAFLTNQYDKAMQIIENEGVVGVWRQSTIMIYRLIWHSTGSDLVSRSNAHVIRDVDFNLQITRGDGFGLVLENNTDRERRIQAYLKFTEFSQAEIDRARRL